MLCAAITHYARKLEAVFKEVTAASSLGGRDRTYGLMVPNHARYHLCHTQKLTTQLSKITTTVILVAGTGFEPVTSWL